MMKAAYRKAWDAYTAHASDTAKFTIVELCFLLACLTPLLFLTSGRGKPLAALCLPAFLLLMAPARVNAAQAMQQALAGGRLFSLLTADPSRYGAKLKYGLTRCLLLLCWGAPLIAALAYGWTQFAGDTDAFTVLRAIKKFGGGEVVRGGIYLFLILLALLILLAVGVAFHSGDRHASVLGDRKLLKGRRFRMVGCWFASLVTVLPLVIALVAALCRYLPLLRDIDTVIMGDAKLPSTKVTLIILGVGGVLTIPLMPLRSLVLAAYVEGMRKA